MRYAVTRSQKDREGDIIGLCGAGWNHTKDQVVTNIRLRGYTYSVTVGSRTTYVRVAIKSGNYYLTTNPDGFTPNNLDDLPDC